MIKYLFILVNAITVFIYSLFGGGTGISVSGNIPKSIKAGTEVPIEIKITKGNMSGFAKLQMDLPEGLSVKEVNSKGASFSFSDGLAKWVWASLPGEDVINVKAMLVASNSSSGTKSIEAKYSFVENNAKQVVEMIPIEINIESELGNNEATNQTTSAETPVASESLTTTETNTTSVNSNKEPENNITAVRTITKGSMDGEYIVNVKIKKGATRGFARYSDDIVDGVIAKSIKNEGSSFSIADGKVKFVWVSVPLSEDLELVYSLSSNSNIKMTLSGEYSYLEDNQTKKFLLPSEDLSLNISEAVTNTAKTENNDGQIQNTTVTETIAISTPTEQTNTEVNKNTETSNTSKGTEEVAQNNSATETGNSNIEIAKKQEGIVNYMVQIGAFTNGNVTSSYLKKKFGIYETVRSEMHEGYSKFMVGSHNEYKGARDQREVIKNNNGVNGAFVVAYNHNKRITVQEAIMITSQKWYK